jgi:hypothetical protein
MSLSRSQGLMHEEWPNIARRMAKPCVANQQSIRDATWEIRAGLLSLKRSAGAEIDIDIDIDTLEVNTSQSKRARGAPGRLRDLDSVGHVGTRTRV